MVKASIEGATVTARNVDVKTVVEDLILTFAEGSPPAKDVAWGASTIADVMLSDVRSYIAGDPAGPIEKTLAGDVQDPATTAHVKATGTGVNEGHVRVTAAHEMSTVGIAGQFGAVLLGTSGGAAIHYQFLSKTTEAFIGADAVVDAYNHVLVESTDDADGSNAILPDGDDVTSAVVGLDVGLVGLALAGSTSFLMSEVANKAFVEGAEVTAQGNVTINARTHFEVTALAGTGAAAVAGGGLANAIAGIAHTDLVAAFITGVDEGPPAKVRGFGLRPATPAPCLNQPLLACTFLGVSVTATSHEDTDVYALGAAAGPSSAPGCRSA